MHPIEHLRYVARARGADPVALVRETSYAVASMGFDPAGLVVACRRIVERHPACGPLWWLAARLVSETDPSRLAWSVADELDEDTTSQELAAAIPDDATVVVVGDPGPIGDALVRRGDLEVLVVDSMHEGSSMLRRLERADVPSEPVPAEGAVSAVGVADLVLVEAAAVSPERALVPLGSSAVAIAGARAGVPVWLVAGTGRRLPDGFVVAMAERVDAGRPAWGREFEVLALDVVDHVVGSDGVRPVDSITPECPFTPELLRTSPI